MRGGLRPKPPLEGLMPVHMQPGGRYTLRVVTTRTDTLPPSVALVLGVCATALVTGLVYGAEHAVCWAFGITPNVPLTFVYWAAWQATIPERKLSSEPTMDVVANWTLWGVFVYHIWALTGAL